MGFGTLFIGYFLLLNFVTASLTDAVSASLILYALYKLAPINREFKLASRIAVFFLAVGSAELLFWMFDFLFSIEIPSVIIILTGALKYLSVGALSFVMLRGMAKVSREVKLMPLCYRCEQVSYLTIPIFGVYFILQILGIFNLPFAKVLSVIAVIDIVCSLVLVAMVLYCIFCCYSKICMPSEKRVEYTEKESRIGFVNAFRRHEEEKQKEYAEYRLEKMRRKLEKKKSKEKAKRDGK